MTSHPGVLQINPLEFARGRLCSACYLDADSSREIHISSLVRHFERAEIHAMNTLRRLSFIREIESLKSGYWIPVPARVVPIASRECMVIAIHPTEELKRHFRTVRRAGAARVADLEEVAALPRQSLGAWQGDDGFTASKWARAILEETSDNFLPSVDAHELEHFGERGGSRQRSGGEPAWIKYGDGRGYLWKGIGLYRARTGKSTYRYFLGKYIRGQGVMEGPSVRNVARMQYGIATLHGSPPSPIIEFTKSHVNVRLPLAPPKELRRLLVALCDEETGFYGRAWTCRMKECFPVVRDALNALTGEVIERE